MPTIEPLSASVHDPPVEARQTHTPAAVPRKPQSGRSRAPIPAWVSRVGIAALLIIVAAIAGRYVWKTVSTLTPQSKPEVAERRAEPPPAARKPTGTLSVTSTPAGARVAVDGKPRGVTPLELADLAPGRHEVVLTTDDGEVRRTVTLAAGKTATIDEAIFSGWIAVYSPFEVTIAEGGRVLRPDDRSQIMLSPGAHTLRFINKSLGYDESRRIDVKPGEGTPVRLTPEPSTLTVTATEPGEVWVDGTRLGDAPINAAPISLGTHDILVRRAAGGERRFTITVTVAPFQLHVDFSQPGA
ncbi:MAG TPA: PEGA domain-containing protein [Vicinamibacterales bacterium]|nr:PEGA domain-containing protein [Vicinamibacterales bacterium]